MERIDLVLQATLGIAQLTAFIAMASHWKWFALLVGLALLAAFLLREDGRDRAQQCPE